MDNPAGVQPQAEFRPTSLRKAASKTSPFAKSPTVTSPRPISSKGSSNRHVAKPGHEEIYLIIHGATSLPSRSDGSDPLPFATL